MDGVLSDFDGHYRDLFGEDHAHDSNESMKWDRIRDHGMFFQTQPLMPDALELWQGLLDYHPTPVILSGIPYSIPNVAYQKGQWRDRYFPGIRLICCASRDKCLHGKRGDILIDDRSKYMRYWTEMGGEFIHHTSVSRTLWVVSTLFGGAKPGR